MRKYYRGLCGALAGCLIAGSAAAERPGRGSGIYPGGNLYIRCLGI